MKEALATQIPPKLYAARDAMRAFYGGASYPDAIATYQGYIREAMEKWKLSELMASLHLVQRLQRLLSNTELQVSLVFAAYVEMIEPAPNTETVCPKCKGVPVEEIDGCAGCLDCDFTGTLEGYQSMQRMMRESYEARDTYIKAGVCSQCGACNSREAEVMCRPTQDQSGEYSCAGDELWRHQ